MGPGHDAWESLVNARVMIPGGSSMGMRLHVAQSDTQTDRVAVMRSSAAGTAAQLSRCGGCLCEMESEADLIRMTGQA